MEARPSRHPSAPSSGAVGSRLRSDRSSLYSLAIVTVLSWGVLAFGSVHPWAYVPLLVMAGAVGIAGLLESKEQAGAYRGMAAALGALCLVGALQMVPLSTEARLAVSPASDRFPGRQSAEPPTGGTPVAAATRTSAVRPLSVDPERTAVGVVLLGGLSLFLLGTARRLSTGDVVSVVRGLLVLGAVLALVGIIQRPFYSGKIYGFWEPQFGGDAFGPFSNRNHFAGWMIMTIPIGLGYFCSGVAAGMRGVKPLLRERLLWFASPAANELVLIGYALVVMAVSLVLTMSRSGLSSFCVALALLGWFAVRAPGAAFRRSLMTGYFAFVLAIASGWVGVEAIGQRFASASWDDVGGGRLPAWRDAAQVISDFPLVGTGIRTYETANRIYQSPEIRLRFADVHNDYLQIAAEGGLLLSIVVVVCLGVLVRQIRHRFREDREQEHSTAYWLRAGAVAGLVAIGLQEVVDFSLQKPGNAVLFAMLVAVAVHRSSRVRGL